MGIEMPLKERKQYALRGPMQATIVKFFDGIDEARQAFRDKQLAELHDFLDSLWHQYDKDAKGFIGIDKVKTLLEDISVGTRSSHGQVGRGVPGRYR